MKQCTKCKIIKEESEFTKDKYGKDGLNGQCKQCRNEYFQQNKEKMIDYSVKYHRKHKEKLKELRLKRVEKRIRDSENNTSS